MSRPAAKRPRRVVALLVLLPFWLVASGAAALWYYQHRENRDTAEASERFARSISGPMLADDLRKLVTIVGERHPGTPDTAHALTRTVSMIEGLLGPGNTGYQVSRINGPADWPLLTVTISGKSTTKPPVWVVTSIDSRPGTPGVEANATGLAATLAAAQALAGDQPHAAIHFAFLPHANDLESPVVNAASVLASRIAKSTPPAAVLCIEAMGAAESLVLSSRDTDAAPLALATGLGTVRNTETICLTDDTDLASILFEMNLPAVRVATRPALSPDEPDTRLPATDTLAASTGRLVELIRRCAAP